MKKRYSLRNFELNLIQVENLQAFIDKRNSYYFETPYIHISCQTRVDQDDDVGQQLRSMHLKDGSMPREKFVYDRSSVGRRT